MQTDYLRDFLMMAKTLNYAEAANNLYISHSSLYKHIKALEEELGGALFDRDGRTITLSAYGQLFLPHAMRLVNVEERCMAELTTWREESAFSVRLSAEYKIWSSVYRFQKNYPQFKFQYQECESNAEMANMLARGTSDFALLCDADFDETEFQRIPYLTDYMAAVLPINHPLAGEERLNLSQLQQEDFVMLPRDTSHYRYCEKIMQMSNFTPHVVLTCTRGTAVVECIANNGGCSIMMEYLTKNQKNSAVKVIRLEPTVEVHVDIWKLRNRKLPPAAKTFLDSILNHS